MLPLLFFKLNNMALIKKYNTGGSFADYLKEGLASGKIKATNKSWNELQKLAPNFDPSKVQRNAETNWAGYYKAETPETATAALAEIYKDYEAKKQNTTKVAITPEGGWKNADRGIRSLFETVADLYGGNKDYTISEIAKLDNPTIKKKVLEWTKNSFSNYINSANSDPNTTWQNLDKIKFAYDKLSNIDTTKDISDEDWTSITALTSGIEGYNLNEFLTPEEVIKQREEIAKTKQTEQEKQSIYEGYKNSGIVDESVLNTLYGGGYTKIADNLNPHMSEYFKNKGYTIYSDEDGTRYGILKDGKFVQSDKGLFTEDQFSDDYGKTWWINEGALNIFDKGTIPEGLELPKWTDQGNLRKRLIPMFENPDNEWKGWTIYGDSNQKYGEYGKDIFQRRDYTSAITLTSPNGESIRAYKQEDGSYKTEDERVLPKFKFSGFGKEFEEVPINMSEELYNSPQFHHLGWGNIKAKDPNTWWKQFFRRMDRGETHFWGTTLSVDQVEKDIQKIQAELTAANAQNRAARIKPGQVAELMRTAKHYFEEGTPEEKEWATANFSKINEILARVDAQGNPIFQFAEGGILKLQEGSTISKALEENKKFAKPVKGELNPITGRTETPKGIMGLDSSTRLKDASGLQVASLVATGLSFVPGVGVIGGTASTVFDAIEGAKDGWDKKDTMNLLGNIGFTILAGVGLGAVKGGKLAVAAGRAGKLAKGADKVEDTTKLAKKAFTQANKAIKTLESSGKLGKETSEALKVAKKVSRIAGEGKIPDAKDLAVVEDLAKIKTTWLGDKTAGLVDVVKYPREFIKNKAPLIGKVGKYGLMGQAGITGASGVLDVGKNVVEQGSLIEGIANTDIDSLRKATQLGGLGRIAYMNRKQANAASKYITYKGGTDNFTTVTIGDEQIKVSGELLKNYSKSWKGKVSGKAKLADKKKFLEDLKGKVSNRDANTITKILKQNKIGKISFDRTRGTLGTPQLKKPEDLVGYRARREYNIAKRMHEKGYTNYASPRRWFSPRVSSDYETVDIKGLLPMESAVKWGATGSAVKAQKGGILKLQQAGTIDYNKDYSIIGNYRNKKRNMDHLPYTEIERINNWIYDNKIGDYSPKYREFVNTVTPEFYNQNIGSIREFVDKQGKGYIPKDAADLQRLMSDRKFGPIHNWVLNYLGNNPRITGLSSPNLPRTTAYVPPTLPKLGFQNPTIPGYPNMKTPTLTAGQSGFNPNVSNNPNQSPTGETIDTFHVLPHTPKKYFNPVPLVEGARLAVTHHGNLLATRNILNSLSKVPKLHFRIGPHLETGMYNTLIAEKQANDLMGQAGRVAGTTSDFDKGAAVKLEGYNNARRLAMEGQYRDIQRNDDIMRHQASLTEAVDREKVDTMNRNSAITADAMSKIYAALANHNVVRSEGNKNFISLLGREWQLHDYKRNMHDLQQLYTNPNVTNAQMYLANLENDINTKSRIQYDNWAKLEKAKDHNAIIPPFEQSEQYKRGQELKRQLSIAPQSFLNDIMMKQMQMRAAVPMAKKGSKLSLDERITLENVKYNHKRLLQSEKLFYKQLMENKKLVQKALIKVFK